MTPQLILGIDPGPTTSGVVLYDPVQRKSLWAASMMPNGEMLDRLREDLLWRDGEDEDRAWVLTYVTLAIETIVSYTRPKQSKGGAGAATLLTAELVGRIREIWHGRTVYAYSRPDILTAITGNNNCKPGPTFERLCEMHGGLPQVAVGTKKAPGPLYGVGSHARSALAVAVVAAMGAKLEEQKGKA